MSKKIVYIILAVAVLCGCTRRIYTPVERVRTDTFVLVERDTISIVNEVERLIERMSHDTICITERITHWVNAADSSTLRTDRERDTYIAKAREANNNLQARYDTLIRQYQQLKEKLQEKQDVVVEVEKPVSGWKKLLLTSYTPITLLLVGLALYYLYTFKRRK